MTKRKPKLRDLVEQADTLRGHAVAPLFGPIDQPAPVADERTLGRAGAAYDAAVALQEALTAKLDSTIAANSANAAMPRRIIKVDEMRATVDAYCRRMIDTGDLPGNPGWKGELAKQFGFKQWRSVARYLPEWGLDDEEQLLRQLLDWKP